MLQPLLADVSVLADAAAPSAADAVLAVRPQFDEIRSHSPDQLTRRLVNYQFTADIAGVVVRDSGFDGAGLDWEPPGLVKLVREFHHGHDLEAQWFSQPMLSIVSKNLEPVAAFRGQQDLGSKLPGLLHQVLHQSGRGFRVSQIISPIGDVEKLR